MPDTNNPNDPFYTAMPEAPFYPAGPLQIPGTVFNPMADIERMIERQVRYLMVHNEDFRRMANTIVTIRHDVDELIAGRMTHQTNTVPNTRNPEPLGMMISVSQLRETMDLLRDLKRTADNINMPRIEAEMFRLAGFGASVTPQHATDLPTPMIFHAREQAAQTEPVQTPMDNAVLAELRQRAEELGLAMGGGTTGQAENRAAITPQTDAGPPY